MIFIFLMSSILAASTHATYPPSQPKHETDYAMIKHNDKESQSDISSDMTAAKNVLHSLLEDYDSRLRPDFGTKDPVVVNVTLHVDSLGPISESDMSYRVDFAFRQYWFDKRLSFDKYHKPLTLSHEFLQKIWLPDTYFPESLSANKHDVMVPNVLLRIHPNGSVLYSCRVTVVGKCPMELKNFPLDVQECKLIIEPYGYTMNDLILNWSGSSAVNVAPNIDLSQFTYIGYNQTNYSLSFTTGNFSDLEVQFKFTRRLLYFVLQSYVPATLIVMLSWVSFWVDPRSIPARASLAITTVLTMITLMGTVNSQLPKVSTIKALDSYFGMCFLYVFGSLLEFSAVCYFDKGSQKRELKRREYDQKVKDREDNERYRLAILREVDGLARPGGVELNHILPNSNFSFSQSSNHVNGNSFTRPLTEDLGPPPKQMQFNVLSVDVYSRILFPTTFLILNLIYWGAYMKIKTNKMEKA